MATQLEVLNEAVQLLNDLLQSSTCKLSDQNKKNIRWSFINRHSWNIHDIASDVLLLGKSGSLHSIYLLSRPALESLFNLSAAVMSKDFAAEKVVSELEDEQKRVERWAAGAEAGWKATLTELMKGLAEFIKELRGRYAVTSKRAWKTNDVAREGKLDAKYIRDYFMGSKHVHATLSSLTDREAGLYISEAVYRLTLCVTHASALLNHAHAKIEGGASLKLLPRLSDLERRAKKTYNAEAASLAESIRRMEGKS